MGNNMRLLVINLQNPAQTRYRNPKDIGTWMRGRRLSNYRFFTLNDNGGLVPIVITDATGIQKAVDTALAANAQITGHVKDI